MSSTPPPDLPKLPFDSQIPFLNDQSDCGTGLVTADDFGAVNGLNALLNRPQAEAQPTQSSTQATEPTIRPNQHPELDQFFRPFLYHHSSHGYAPPPNSPNIIFDGEGEGVGVGEVEDESDIPEMNLEHMNLVGETRGQSQDQAEGQGQGVSGIDAKSDGVDEVVTKRMADVDLSGRGSGGVVVLGISGASSSGKSLLGTLLGAIFEAAGNEVTIISQDSFFLPKHLCPITSFHSTPADADFMNAGLRAGELKDCLVYWDGTRHNSPNDAISSPTRSEFTCQPTSTSDSSGRYEGSYQVRYTITGPDTDCDEAIDFHALYHHVKFAISNPGAEELENKIKAPHAKPDLEKYENLITEMRDLVASKYFSGGALGDKRIVIVEGFLLFEEPGLVAATNSGDDVRNTQDIKSIDTTSPFNSVDDFSTLTDAEIEERLKLAEEANAKLQSGMKTKLQSLLDIKFFLPISKQTAKNRRFSRKEYIDFEKGGGRQAGNMWRSEGYFDEVVWGNYENSYGWLLSEDRLRAGEVKVVKGINVMVEDADLVESVKWAVEIALEGMKGLN